MDLNERQDTPATSSDTTAVLLEAVRRFAAESRARSGGEMPVTLDSSLEKDLGLDSLGRVELLMRVERAFGVSLPEHLLASAETPRDLLRAVLAASPATAATVAMPRGEAPERVESEPSAARTLTEALDWHVSAHPQRTHIIILDEAGGEMPITYAELRDSAAEIAAGLLERGLQPGQSVALMLPTGRDYFRSFFGVLLAGGVPVPIYPPARPSQIEDHLRRHAGILSNALAAMLVTVPEAKAVARLLQAQVETLRAVVTADELAGAGQAPGYALQPGQLALLQYTSGSTANPKGVALTHANLLANVRAMGQASQAASTDVFVSWLPLYHDMGLIGAWLASQYYAIPLVAMSPLTFLARPERWLWAIHKHRGTYSAAPNFGYELCLRKIPDEALEGLDLSALRWAFNGAEPVSPDTMENFAKRFERYGLRREALAPVYGLAEDSVGLAFPPPLRGTVVDRIDRDRFTRSGRAEPVGEEEKDALRFVACGRPLPGHQIRIVDATGRELGERIEGRLEFKGPSSTAGYFRNPEQNRALFHEDWLDSGDYAYVAEGDVYITGRAKDIVIRAGRNIYPHELEEAVGGIPGVRKGCVAVFGSPDPVSGTERLVVMAETRETGKQEREELRARINALTVDMLGTPADDIVLAPMHAVLKTSSGKIRRAACREVYEHGGVPRRAVWWQVVRITWTAALPELRRASRAISSLLYAAYVWSLFWVIASVTWLTAVLLPRPSWSWAASRVAARLYARLTATPLAVHGLENLPATPCVLAVNHASYLDGIVLAAALPNQGRQYSFVAKKELQGKFIPRTYLRHIATDFVERFDPQQGAADVQVVAASLRAGRCPVFFPEGTFDRNPGLLPFRMGAFVVAAEAGVPVVPVTIRGTRSILRGDDRFPRHGAVAVIVGAPIMPDGNDWAAAVRLRDKVRAEILRLCGEPDLAAAEKPERRMG
jgi:acyl carrier protein